MYSRNGIKYSDVEFGLIFESTIRPLNVRLECENEWLIFYKTKNQQCMNSGINIRGKEVFVIPERWKRQKTVNFWLYIIPILLIILLFFIARRFIKCGSFTDSKGERSIIED